jgi:hypothetical protein
MSFVLKMSFVSVLVLLRSSDEKIFSGSQRFFERHGWVMKEATIFSWEDVPTRTTAGVVYGNEVRVYGVTTEAEIMTPINAKPHLLEYMDLQMGALDKEHLRNDLDAH